jgi:hypothetical protein
MVENHTNSLYIMHLFIINKRGHTMFFRNLRIAWKHTSNEVKTKLIDKAVISLGGAGFFGMMGLHHHVFKDQVKKQEEQKRKLVEAKKTACPEIEIIADEKDTIVMGKPHRRPSVSLTRKHWG